MTEEERFVYNIGQEVINSVVVFEVGRFEAGIQGYAIYVHNEKSFFLDWIKTFCNINYPKMTKADFYEKWYGGSDGFRQACRQTVESIAI